MLINKSKRPLIEVKARQYDQKLSTNHLVNTSPTVLK